MRALTPLLAVVTLFAALLRVAPAARAADDIASQPPINYPTVTVNDPIARLQRQIDAGKLKLDYDDAHGYLAALLNALGIKPSTQTLVFSKTSFQRDLIAPWKPRALYFNDDVYVGFVQGGEVLEIASVDKQTGPIFYSLSQAKAARPKFQRQTDACLQCHESSSTQNVPGLMVRSVFPDASGMPMYSAGTFRTTDASPWAERWGGWYVTGTHGSQRHMGNLIVRKRDDPDHLDLDANANLTDLSKKIDVAPYLAATSDVVALMVLAHQTNVHNLITSANYQTRLALRDQAAMNKALNEKPDHQFESTQRRIKSACEPLVKALLFCEEQPLTDAVAGSPDFVRDFTAHAPRDPQGRSLRDFDLKRRLFKYPCSFLIYTEQFDALPPEARAAVYQKIADVCDNRDASKDFAHLTPDDRAAIKSILLATKKDAATLWPKSTSAAAR